MSTSSHSTPIPTPTTQCAAARRTVAVLGGALGLVVAATIAAGSPALARPDDPLHVTPHPSTLQVCIQATPAAAAHPGGRFRMRPVQLLPDPPRDGAEMMGLLLTPVPRRPAPCVGPVQPAALPA